MDAPADPSPYQLRPLAQVHRRQGLLHKALTAAEHDKVLAEMWRQSRSSFEESGAILLHITLGLLQWFVTPTSTQPRFSPLILLPVQLSRGSAPGTWQLRRAQEEARINVTLLKKLEVDFALQVGGLYALPEDESRVDIRTIMHDFKVLVANQPRWQVLDLAQLGVFSFQKFLMWLDLQAKQAVLPQNPVVRHQMTGDGQ